MLSTGAWLKPTYLTMQPSIQFTNMRPFTHRGKADSGGLHARLGTQTPSPLALLSNFFPPRK